MGDEKKALFGSWVQAAGTTISAIGSTPSHVFTKQQLESLNLWGNVLQATGNSLVADSEETVNLSKIGNQIQAAGNVTVVAAIVIDFSERTAQELTIKGNLLQALGGSAAFSQALSEEPSPSVLLDRYGNLLQVIGNSLQAISGIIEINGGRGQKINTIGSWIQAIGSILSAIGQEESQST